MGNTPKTGADKEIQRLQGLTKQQAEAVTRIQQGYEERIARQVGIINRYMAELEELKKEAMGATLVVGALLHASDLPDMTAIFTEDEIGGIDKDQVQVEWTDEGLKVWYGPNNGDNKEEGTADD